MLRRSHILKTPSRWKFLDAFPSHLDSMASPLAWNPGASRIVEGQREKIVEADKLDYVIYLFGATRLIIICEGFLDGTHTHTHTYIHNIK